MSKYSDINNLIDQLDENQLDLFVKKLNNLNLSDKNNNNNNNNNNNDKNELDLLVESYSNELNKEGKMTKNDSVKTHFDITKLLIFNVYDEKKENYGYFICTFEDNDEVIITNKEQIELNNVDINDVNYNNYLNILKNYFSKNNKIQVLKKSSILGTKYRFRAKDLNQLLGIEKTRYKDMKPIKEFFSNTIKVIMPFFSF